MADLAERLKTAQSFAEDHDLEVTWSRLERECPEVVEGLSDWHKRHVEHLFEYWITRLRIDGSNHDLHTLAR